MINRPQWGSAPAGQPGARIPLHAHLRKAQGPLQCPVYYNEVAVTSATVAQQLPAAYGDHARARGGPAAAAPSPRLPAALLLERTRSNGPSPSIPPGSVSEPKGIVPEGEHVVATVHALHKRHKAAPPPPSLVQFVILSSIVHLQGSLHYQGPPLLN